jgi:hypothetical protein
MYRPLVICCSQRFKEELDSFVRFLKKRGVEVAYPNFRRHRKSLIHQPEQVRLRSESYKVKISGMVLSHLQRIRETAKRGGLCLIFNPKADKGQRKKYGYIGLNTTGEIFYSNANDVTVLMLRPHEEACIMALTAQIDPARIFSTQHPKASCEDWDYIWNHWLKEHLGGGNGK